MTQNTKNLVICGVIVAVIAVGGLLYFFFGQNTAPKLFSVEAKNGDITQETNLTGQVKASEGADLAFNQQGQITANYVKVGDMVYAGQTLASIDSATLQAQLQVAEAQLDAVNLNVVQGKNNAALQSAYASALAADQKSVSVAKQALISVFNVQSVLANTSLQNAKGIVVESLLGQGNAGFWQTWQIENLNGGAFGLAQTAVNNQTQSNIDSALSATLKSLQDLNNFINNLPADPNMPPADRAVIVQQKSTVNMEIITTSANIQAISSLKVNNSATITSTNAQVEAAEAAVNVIRTQISKTVLTAPFAGQVAKDDVVVGAIASPNASVITISNNNFEIDTNIPEVDLASAKIGQAANITLDAFGNSTIFPATIISVDSAPSIVNGISVYGAKLKFNNSDDRIKIGMAANINLISDTHSNVVTVPISAVIQQNGKYFVIVDNGSKKESREVTIGWRDDKNIEITSGLKSGEKVLAY